MSDQYNYEYEWDSKYCYPNSYVLKNKLNITDAKAFSVAEREITSITLLQLVEYPVKGNLDFNHLKKIHEEIFTDIFDWAGQVRTVNISKGNMFCFNEYIENSAGDLFKELRSEKYLQMTNPNEICKRLSYYLGEINVIHPFREGNGRTQRVFINYLAKVAGYHIDFTNVTSAEMIECSAMAFGGNYEPMAKLLNRIVSKISEKEQKESVNAIFKDKFLLNIK